MAAKPKPNLLRWLPERKECIRAYSREEGDEAGMPAGDHYRARAKEFSAEAEKQNEPHLRSKYENLAESYLRLAQEADKNALTIDVELPPEQDTNTKR